MKAGDRLSLEGVKVGDQIVYERPVGIGRDLRSLVRVIRLTKLHVVIRIGDQEIAVRKKDGRPPGSTLYDRRQAWVPDAEERAQLTLERKRRIAKNLVAEIDWEKIPASQCDALIMMFAPKR